MDPNTQNSQPSPQPVAPQPNPTPPQPAVVAPVAPAPVPATPAPAQAPVAPTPVAQQPMPQQPTVPQPMPPQPVQQHVSPAAAIAAQQAPATAQSIQHAMRNRILKIIGAMSAVSLAAVFLLFLISGASDPSIAELRAANNAQAEYSVPVSWSEDNTGDFVAYYNQETLQASQATYLVINPIRASFDEARISDAEMETITNEYRRRVNEGEAGALMSAPTEVEVVGFYKAYDLILEGVADDGRTEIRGISRVLFDDNNYIHTIEFVSVRAYWEANETEIQSLLDTYTLRASE